MLQTLLRRSCNYMTSLLLANPRVGSIRYYGVDDDGDIRSDMRTTVTILNHEQDGAIYIDSYSPYGFVLNSGFRVMGPCAIFPRSILHWNIKGVDDISERSLALFTMLEPKIDLLLLGVGERDNLKRVDSKIIKFLRSNKINTEILPTDQALATFNFLNAERRSVAGAFIPPSYMENVDEDTLYESQTHVEDPATIHGGMFGPPKNIPDDDNIGHLIGRPEKRNDDERN